MPNLTRSFILRGKPFEGTEPICTTVPERIRLRSSNATLAPILVKVRARVSGHTYEWTLVHPHARIRVGGFELAIYSPPKLVKEKPWWLRMWDQKDQWMLTSTWLEKLLVEQNFRQVALLPEGLVRYLTHS